MRRTPRLLALLAVLVGLVGLVAACGDDTEPATDANEPLTIEITVEKGKFTPNGDTIEVATGQEVRLEIKADAPGELHVHSDPEQTHEYGAGTTRVSLGAFDVPGQFPIESHAAHTTVATLKVQ